MALKIANYAVNGVGLGHVTRLIGINRWIRRLAEQAGDRAEIYFMTSSEATQVLYFERFVSLKISDPRVAQQAGLDGDRYCQFAATWLRRGLELLRPDLMIVDTFPQGDFGEFPDALRACHRTAFVYRPISPSVAGQPGFQSALRAYDAILVPECEETGAVTVLPALRNRLRYIGPVIIRDRDEILPRRAARDQLMIGANRLAIYLSMGGGGGAMAEESLHAIAARLQRLSDVHLIVGAGPLSRRAALDRTNLTWLTRPAMCEFMAGFDIAVSAAGYNSFVELMHFGVPTIFVPRALGPDDQHGRAQRAVAAGAAVCVDPEDLNGIEKAVETWRSPALRHAAADAARRVVPVNCARDFATYLWHLASADPRRPSLRARVKAVVPRPLLNAVRSARSKARRLVR
jgi:UDP-N-acetylglucosamine--N-acetylmuramyl-(pentapeptide) pyrophosphoryl-undecaprenol N-acetylglucosamine transferase